ncbi:MAG TPA: tRNA 2-thiouridine(34) synthase MnmA [Mesotoga infera]|nr:tRNA 2-thiouridine(34) synthase MnmA [Mesotoga infera]
MKVGIALSGGVDSAVAAALMIESGYSVTGYHMIVLPTDGAITQAVEDATKVAEHLGIELKILDLSHQFRKTVIEYFKVSYATGLTPNPCVLCNDIIKFGIFAERILADNNEAIATGHYARIIRDDDGRFFLARASFDRKDQAYFLSRVKKEKLSFIRFPNGELSKEEVRQRARSLAIPVHSKKDSQEICFIPDNDYRNFLHGEGIESSTGDIVKGNGEVIGRHNGLTDYTIGQRRGLGINFREKLYVKDLDFTGNRLVLGRREELVSFGLEAVDPNWYIEPEREFDCLCKIRSSMNAVKAHVRLLEADRVAISFSDGAWGVTPGQLAVLYNDEVVLGSAFIERSC